MKPATIELHRGPLLQVLLDVLDPVYQTETIYLLLGATCTMASEKITCQMEWVIAKPKKGLLPPPDHPPVPGTMNPRTTLREGLFRSGPICHHHRHVLHNAVDHH